MSNLVSRPAFDFDELRFDWGDVILAAIGWDEWQLLERLLAEGLSCVATAQDSGAEVDAEALRASIVTFRRARGLLAGEDYLRWLAERGLSVEDVRAHFTRAALREQMADQLAGQRPGDGQLAEAIDGEAILSGRLQLWADRLVRCAAAARGLATSAPELPTGSEDSTATVLLPPTGGWPPGQPPMAVEVGHAVEVSHLIEAAAACRASGLNEAQARERAPRIAGLLAAERTFADRLVTRERLERCLAEHRFDWQRFVWEEVTFADEGPAREAALWVREDGMALTEVAGLAQVAANVREAYSDDVSELAGLLTAAAPGELLGPLAGEGGWRLLRMRERTPPAVDDIVLHERASAELVDDALGRYLAGRVAWHVKH